MRRVWQRLSDVSRAFRTRTTLLHRVAGNRASLRRVSSTPTHALSFSTSTSKVSAKLGDLSLSGLTGKSNLLLMGPPGSGKSSVARLLSQELGMDMIDVDDDHLERVWGGTVEDKLAEVGDDAFLALEGETTCQLQCRDSVVSLSGSNPLHAGSMEHLLRDGVLVYLDVSKRDILDRMARMKVGRIVGASSRKLGDVIRERREVYDSWYDLRVLVQPGEKATSVARRVMGELTKRQVYVSTRGGESRPMTFLDVVSKGLAPDRGLYVPLDWSPLRPNELERLAGRDYVDVALRVLEKFPLGRAEHDFRPADVKAMLRRAYKHTFEPAAQDVVLPVKHLERDQHLMETFHGPTASFKDLSLQLTPKLLSAASERVRGSDGGSTGLIVATSGDTGCAALHGFLQERDTPVVVLYPKNGVSLVQEAQMRTTAGDAHVVGVEGDFDDCQNLVKQFLNDTELTEQLQADFGVRFSSGNSINWGRFLPQVVFTVASYVKLLSHEVQLGDEVDVCIPTGNFGNILGAYVAKKMGLPLGTLICASNENNVLTDFVRTGVYDLRARKFQATMSPSIDILVSSNLERFLYLLYSDMYDREHAHARTRDLFEQLSTDGWFEVEPEVADKMREDLWAGWCSEAECKETIRSVFKRTGKLIDPHTAVAKKVADSFRGPKGTAMLISSTAHFAKFPDAMVEALKPEWGDQVAALRKEKDVRGLYELLEQAAGEGVVQDQMHTRLSELLDLETVHHDVIKADFEEVVGAVRGFLKQRRA